MQSGKKVLLVFFALLFLAIGFIFWVGATGGGTANRPPMPSATSAAASGSTQGASKAYVRDKRARDEVRRRILAAWAAADSDVDEETRKTASAGRFVPRPDADGGGIGEEALQTIAREVLFPLAGKCYEEHLVHQRDAGGVLALEFTIAGDDEIGGIVEEAAIAKTSSLRDERLETCVRESLFAVSFPPTAHDGVNTVVLTFGADRQDQ